MELPPGFRFHPTDEELITHYLSLKVLDESFCALAIGEVDLNKVEPWDLPLKAKMGEKEWYFFCVRDRKYPTGVRTNRATDAGYWKATGKDKEIFRGKTLVGMKKTLVFYKGRAPKGEKTNWVMHEYRLEDKFSIKNLPKTATNEWVISRIFRKSSGLNKTHISGLINLSNCSDELNPSNLPPLLDLSPYDTCFSNSMEDQKTPQGNIVDDSFNTSCLASSSSSKPCINSSYIETLQFPESIFIQDQSILRFFLDNNGGANLKQNCKAEFSQDTGISTDYSSAMSNHDKAQRSYEDEEYLINSAGPVELDSLWDY